MVDNKEKINKLWDEKRAIERSAKKKGRMTQGQWSEIIRIKCLIHKLNNAPLVD